MAKNRAGAIKFILDCLKEISPNCPELESYPEIFSKMSDKEFDELMQDFKTGKRYVKITVPNLGKDQLNLETNFKLADKLGLKLFKRIWMPAEGNNPAYLTPEEYLTIRVPFRLMSQRIAKKQSIPHDQRHINALTGQPTGESKGASISYPEVRQCLALGLEKTLTELMKYRGGDNRGYMALNASLMRHGRASLESLSHFATGAESTKTLKTFLTSAHLKSTL